MGIVISSETVQQALQVNAQAILSKLEEWAQSQCLFSLYDNMNFYKKVHDQRLHNKVHLVNYIAGYICFMNIADGNTLPYINSDQVQHEALSSLIADNFLLDQVDFNHRAIATRFILGCALKQYFTPAMRKQKHLVAGKVIPKFFNWSMPLKNI